MVIGTCFRKSGGRAALLGGERSCSTKNGSTPQGVPLNHRKVVITHLHTTFYTPGSQASSSMAKSFAPLEAWAKNFALQFWRGEVAWIVAGGQR